MNKNSCDKIPYDSLEEARQAIEDFEIDKYHNHKPIRVYKCDICDNKYHSTSLDQDKKTKKNINRKDRRSESKKINTNYKVDKKTEKELLKAMRKIK